MKLLLSAYACAPNFGSDHAVGWQWTTEAHRQGHQIWALASPNHQESITRACRESPDLAGIQWCFPKVRGWPLKQAVEPRWERTYNLLWQRAALRQAVQLHRKEKFDAVHHVTWGGIRAPTFLGALECPLLIGPIGGGETSPGSLRDELGFRGRLLEWIRDATTATININPLVSPGLRRATAIFVYTRETLNLFPDSIQKKTTVFTPVSIRHLPNVELPRMPSAKPRLLFAGRLVYWKGVHIALTAFSELSKHVPEARFTIVGDGPERKRLKSDAERLGIKDQVEFISKLPQQELFKLYETHDLFVFPSLHDSGGFVVIEALSRGMPVVCLDLGGPGYMVTPACGIVVRTSGRSTQQVALDMGNQIQRLFTAPEEMRELSVGAVARAGEFILNDRVKVFYDLAIAAMHQMDKPSRPPANAGEGMRRRLTALLGQKFRTST